MVRFAHPFLLAEIDTELPAGNYTIETEEESLEGATFLAFRRVETILVARPAKGKTGATRFWTIDPEGLTSALARDAELTLAGLQDGADTVSPPVIKPKLDPRDE